MMRASKTNLFSIVLFILQIPLLASAQSTGLLKGLVKSGTAVLDKASISLDGDLFRTTVFTDRSGSFIIQNIPAGRYNLTASAAGYKKHSQQVTLQAGAISSLTIELERAFQSLQELVVQANRYQKEDDIIDISKVVQPVTVINKKTIEMMGSRRLDEVLREQTGIAIVNDLGSGNRSIGLQMQGFGAAYIAILINGQPMAGRFNGNFDLSRISVSDIERIEIIKGASSSLYGCEALGGVVNIITRQVITRPQLSASLQYGTYNTLEAVVKGETTLGKNRGSFYLSGDYYTTDGFNVNSTYLKEGQTAPPYTSINIQGRARYKLSGRHALNISARVSGRSSVMDRSYGVQHFVDRLRENDLNGAAILNSNLENGTRLVTRYYFTRYAAGQQVSFKESGQQLQQNRFVQVIHKMEWQAAHDLANKKASLIAGMGGDYQLMNNRSGTSRNTMFTYFGYTQVQYKPSGKYDLSLGLRYDGNTAYGGKLNPVFGADYKPVKWIGIKLSVGQGFKAPTFAQLYQVFTNITQGYTVTGANMFHETVRQMENAGMIENLWPLAQQVTSLKPETSTSINTSLTLQPHTSLEVSVNGFYNHIRNQIFSQQVGIMANSQQLFSYFNIERSFTTGMETALKWSPVTAFTITAGYQYLVAKDKGIVDSIKAGQGKYNKVRADGGIRNATARDYFNLPGRSRHSANLQAFYELNRLGLGISIRGNYRGKYGFLDIDNNGYIDPYDVYVDGYFLLYASIRKELLKRKLTFQLSVDNIFDYTDYLMPAQPGRTIMAGLSWKLFSKDNTDTIKEP